MVVSLAHGRELTFPAVTICNMNPVKLTNLNYSAELETLLTDGSSVDVEAEAIEILAEVDETTKMTYMGYQRDDFILDCQYSGSDCNME